MIIYWLPRTAEFQGNFIRFLDIDTGIEFFAEDILMLVSPECIEKGIHLFIEAIPLKLRRKRQVFAEGEQSVGRLCQLVDTTFAQRDRRLYSLGDTKLKEIDTLCWLALKYIFNLFGYEKHREFVRWLRKDVALSSRTNMSLSLPLAKLTNNDRILGAGHIFTIQPPLPRETKLVPAHNVSVAARLPASELIVTKLNSLHWFNIITNHEILSLSDMYLNSCFSLIGAPPTLVPAIQEYSLRDKNLDVAVLEALYLSFLYKRVNIPPSLDFDPGLPNRLLRKRYLDCCQMVLQNENISYSDLYLAFVTDTNNLFLAQELDIALLFSYFRKHLSFPIIRVLEGGVFLQALELCGLAGTLDNQLVSSLKVAYLNWLSSLLEEIISSI